MIEFEESDQAGFMDMIYASHLNQHGGKIDKECKLCSLFFPELPPGRPVTSCGIILFDISDENNGNYIEYIWCQTNGTFCSGTNGVFNEKLLCTKPDCEPCNRIRKRTNNNGKYI